MSSAGQSASGPPGRKTKPLPLRTSAPKHRNDPESTDADLDGSSCSDEDSSGSDVSSENTSDDVGRLAELYKTHMSLLSRRPADFELSEVNTSPIFTGSVLNKIHPSLMGTASGGNLPAIQYGLVGGDVQILAAGKSTEVDPRIFHNVTSPSSVFICGSQGSGKSHTLSCLLENCLAPSAAGVLPKPLTGVVFHFDTFSSDVGGLPCEAAYLASSRDVKVRVLCAPTNIRTIKV